MSGLDKEGRYRVLLIKIGDNTEEEKEIFCHNISKNHNIPYPLLRKIVDHSPIVLRKNLSLKRSEMLAGAFRAFGATVSIEKRKDFPSISLEFQELVPHQLDLESSYLQKTERGTWSVLGRVKNISDETLNDTWVLIQLFDHFEEFITFEETPLPINPLPSGETSPFKVVFERDFPIRRISIGFKNASGQPIAALDKRKKREWEEVKMGDEHFASTARMSTKAEERSQPIDLSESKEQMTKEGDPEIQQDPSLSFKPEATLLFGEMVSGREGEEEEGSSGIASTPFASNFDISPNSTEEIGNQLTPPVSEELEEDAGKERIPLLEVIPERVISEKERKVEPPPFPWIENFRDAVETFFQKPRDIFLIWFEECRKKGEFKNSLHPLLTILVHSRFDQREQSVKALENTQRVVRLITRPTLLLEDIPLLEATPFVPGDVWRDLFHRAIPKIHQIGKTILERNKWSAFDLEQVIRVIPHMGHENSRKAVQWINDLIPDVVVVDLSDALISVGESLYRVASRLGIVDPYFDYYQGPHSPGDIKIQSFAKMAFPQNPMKSEEPMAEMGREEEQGGHCFAVQPRCEGCLFETFCPKLYIHFDPSGKGLRE